MSNCWILARIGIEHPTTGEATSGMAASKSFPRNAANVAEICTWMTRLLRGMPVILGETEADAWLNEPSALAVCELLRPYPADEMKMDYIGTQVPYELNLGF